MHELLSYLLIMYATILNRYTYDLHKARDVTGDSGPTPSGVTGPSAYSMHAAADVLHIV